MEYLRIVEQDVQPLCRPRKQMPWRSTLNYLTLSSQVTGASGFIGSHVTLQLLEAGYRVKGYYPSPFII